MNEIERLLNIQAMAGLALQAAGGQKSGAGAAGGDAGGSAGSAGAGASGGASAAGETVTSPGVFTRPGTPPVSTPSPPFQRGGTQAVYEPKDAQVLGGQMKGEAPDPNADPKAPAGYVSSQIVPVLDLSGTVAPPRSAAAPPIPTLTQEGGTKGMETQERTDINNKYEEAIALSRDAALEAAAARRQHAEEAMKEAARQEAAAIRLKKAEDARLQQLEADIFRKHQQAALMSSAEIMAGTFFANTEKFNSTVLAAGLARAGLHDQAAAAINASIGREYNMQRNAIEAAKMRGERTENALSRLRDIYQNEKAADLAFEQMATSAASKKLQSMIERSQGALDQSAAMATVTKLEADQMERRRRLNLEERKHTNNPQDIKVSERKMLEATGYLKPQAAADGSAQGAGAASQGSAPAQPVTGSTGAGRQAAAPSAGRPVYAMAPGDPQWNRAVKFGKSGEGLVQGTTVAVKFGDKDVRDGVRLMVPTGKKVINVSGTLFVTDKDNEQGKKLQETYTAATITTRHTNALHAAAEDLRRIKATGSLGAKERRLIENHMAQLAAVAKANWWKGFVDSGVMQEGESKRAEAATGAVGSIASRMSNYLNEKTGIDYDFGNDIDSIVQATTSLAAMTKPYNSLDLAHRLGFREIKSGPAFGYDSNGNPVDARSLPKGSPLYMIGDM